MQPRPRNNLSLFIGLWLGLTFIAGTGVFALFYWALSGRGAATPRPTQAPTPAVIVMTPLPTSVPVSAAQCAYPTPPASGFGYGIQSNAFPGEGDFDYWMDMIHYKLGLQWMKLQVRWADVEKTQGQIDWGGYLDNVMKSACAKGVHMLFSVVTAPAWTWAAPLPAPDGQGAPPDNYQHLANFIAALLDRYPGQIGAIEVWNEENLEREWNTTGGVSPAEYVKMLSLTYATIKAKDPNIVVISGALSPTGVNCFGGYPACPGTGRPVVMDDASYLQQFIAAGGLAFADCIGTHSNGTNLPPTADGAHPPGDGSGYTFRGPWNSPHYSWALASQINTYAALLNGRKKQCVTEFGYPSPVDGKFPTIYGYAADIDEQKQGQYLVAAFDWMRASNLVQMAFLFNLDYSQKGGGPPDQDENVLYSLITPQGAPRPAFDAISAMPKP
jgi:hypothetical protein